MQCREVADRITDYMEAALPLGSRLGVIAHLARCPGCRRVLRQMRETAKLLAGLPRTPIAPDDREQLLARFRATYPPVVRRRAPRRGWLVLATTLLASLLLGLLPGGAGQLTLDGANHCLTLELLAAFVPFAVLLGYGRWRGGGTAPLLGITVAAGGAVFGQMVLQVMCPMSGVKMHLLVVHFGGVLLATMMAWLTLRLWSTRA